MQNDSDKEIVSKVTEAFGEWCKDNQCTDPEVIYALQWMESKTYI
jgi:hypothetical protein